MSEQNDVLARYATLRARLDQPVTVTELIAPAFRAVYDFAVAQRRELAQANALWQEHGLQAQLDAARRGRDKHGERARLAEAEADQLRERLAAEIAKRQHAETELAACQRSRTLLHLEVCVLQAEASGDYAQARVARAAYLAAAEPTAQP